MFFTKSKVIYKRISENYCEFEQTFTVSSFNEQNLNVSVFVQKTLHGCKRNYLDLLDISLLE